MKKIIVLLMLICLCLIGCGQKETPPDQSDNEVSETVESSAEPDVDSSTEDVEVEEGFIDAETSFDCTSYKFSCIGMKEYSEVSGDSNTDLPDEGNVYLVLFLNVRNNTPKSLYFTPKGIEAEVDGETIDTSFLFNTPDGYSPIFGDIGFQNQKSGFIVWQVPEDWSELSFTYTGLEFSEQIRFSGKITKEMLFDPPTIEE